MQHKSVIAAAGLTFMLACTAASAAPTLFLGGTQFEDDNVDTLSFDANGNGQLDVGDRLTAILDFGRILPVVPGPGYDPAEITAYTEIEVASISGGRVTYRPSATFAATYGAGAMLALYYDTANNLNLTSNPLCTSVAGCLGPATDGSLYGVLGLVDADNEWYSTGSTDFASASMAPATTKLATVNFGLDFLPGQNFTGYDFGPQSLLCNVAFFSCAGDGKVQVIGSADILGGAGLAPNHVRSDSDLQFAPLAVPEPGSLSLVAAALIGVGITTRRRKTA